MPEWNGVYFYGDWCTGNIWGLLPAAGGWNVQLLYPGAFRTLTSFGLEETGEIYLATSANGGIYQLAPKEP